MEKGPINKSGTVAEIRSADAAPGTRGADKINCEKLRKACTDFESLMIYHMMKFMRQSVPQNGFLSGGPGQDIYQSLFDQEVSKNLALRSGLGIGEKIYRQMIQRAEAEKEVPTAPELNPLKAGRRDSE